MIDEKELVQQARRGDGAAFNQLVIAFQQQMFNLALRILLDEKLAEDVTQEAFLAAFRALSGFRGGSFRAWMARIVTNRCYDELRRQKRQPSLPIESMDENGMGMDDPPVLKDESDLPEDKLAKSELENAIVKCIKELGIEYRTALLLVDVQGFDYQEASQVIGKRIGTLKSRLARARLAVQDCLQGAWELLPESYRQKGDSSHA